MWNFKSHCYVLVTLIAIQLPSVAWAQRDEYNTPPIDYSKSQPNDPVAQLSKRINAGDIDLPYDDDQGFLPAVLEALDIPVSSQTLVFSKTSMQRSSISPGRPRAVYFNDDVYVGYCRNGDVLEVASTDPQLGGIFYTLKQTPADRPHFIRDEGQCLTCHTSSRTQNVPGYLIRSVFSNSSGMPQFANGTFTTDHTSPFAERWGGWYVTGTHGDMRHMGNAIVKKREDKLDRETHANLTDLNKLVSTDSYPSPHSDIVALMVMEHQTQMHNAITWANHETRRAIHQSQVMNKILERPEGFLSESAERRIGRAAERVLEYLLMCDEFSLTSPVKGTSRFAEEFQSRGIRDPEGRSLRDFDLKTRMFRYPCSYLIHSDAFAGLPREVRERIFENLIQILDGKTKTAPTDRFSHLTDMDRHNIKQILTATMPEFRSAIEPRSQQIDRSSDKRP